VKNQVAWRQFAAPETGQLNLFRIWLREKSRQAPQKLKGVFLQLG
jgi:hypothetical protein